MFLVACCSESYALLTSVNDYVMDLEMMVDLVEGVEETVVMEEDKEL